MNLLFFDTETTGLDEKYDSIIQLSGFLKVNGEEVEQFNWRIKPYNGNPIGIKAKEKHGISNEEASQYPEHTVAYKEFVAMLERNGIGPDNKAFVVGYNSKFDTTMLRGLFVKNRDFNLWKKYIYSPDIDVMILSAYALNKYRYALKDFTLDTVYKFLFNESFDAHEAVADIRATARIFNFLNEKFFNNFLDEKYNPPTIS